MLTLDKVTAGYGALTVLHGVSLSIGNGEAVAVVGANGAGKSTLLSTLAGLLKPDDTGRATAAFDTPPAIGTPTGLAVSIEPDGGVPAPTGDLYLVGLAQ